MSAVNCDHFKARPFGKPCDLSVRVCNVCDLLMGQSLHRHAVVPDTVHGAILHYFRQPCLVGHISACKLSAVGEQHTGNGAVALDHIGSVGKAGQRADGLQVQTERLGTVCGRMHFHRTYRDSCGTALGLQFVICAGSGTNAKITCNICAAGRCRKHAVSKCNRAQFDRTT